MLWNGDLYGGGGALNSVEGRVRVESGGGQRVRLGRQAAAYGPGGDNRKEFRHRPGHGVPSTWK